MRDLPDFLSDEPSRASEATQSPEPAAQPEPQPTPEANQGQPRDETGKFAPKVTAEPEPAPQPAPQPEPQPVAHSVPLPTFLEMRDKLSHTEAELKRLTEWRQQQEAQARAQPVNVPDPNEDPVGYQEYQREAVQAEMFVMRRDFSRQFAVTQHGQEAVDAAWKWGIERCDADPHFNAKVRGHPDPAGFVVSEWKRDQVASKVDPNEYEAYLAWKAAGGHQAAPAQLAPAGAPTPAPVAPRPSLAAAPSAGASSSVEAVTGEERFSRMFP